MASILQEKSKDFALQIIKVCNEIKLSKRESVLTNQLSVLGPVSVQISGRLCTPMERLTLSQNCKLP